MRKIFLFVAIFIGVQVFAQAPSGYYATAEGKSDAALKTALYGIIGAPDVTSYAGLWTAFRKTDVRTDGKVWDIYSNTTNYVFGNDQCGNYSGEGDCYNREHSFPKSWFNDASPMYSDLYHLYPSDGYVNGIRGNYPFGEVQAVKSLKAEYSNNNFSKRDYPKSGTTGSYTDYVFEPNDMYKGDLARTYFYMVTAYENQITSWGSPHLNGTRFPAFNNWSIELLLKWHRQDPVSQKEINRNNDIHYGYQSNRNPFIDYPELAEHIWGNKKGAPWSATATTDPTLLNPRHGTTLDFGDVPYQQNTVYTVEVKAINLTGDLNLSLSGGSGTYSIPVSQIAKADAEKGYQLAVSINPQTTGLQQATLTISGGGITTSSVQLKANSTSQFLALPATDISSNSFTANWTLSEGASSYVLDVYTYLYTGTESRTILEETFNVNGLPTNWTSEGYFNNEEEGSIRLASGKSNGAITTPKVDLSEPTTLTIVAKSWEGDNSDMYVLVDNQQYTYVTLTNSFAEYVIELPAFTSASTITVLANKGKRLHIDNFLLATEGDAQTKESVSGYPKNVGNVLSYKVMGLMSDSTYYYTVTPHGNGAVTSSEIEVKTLQTTDTKEGYKLSNLVAYTVTNTLYVSNLEPGSVLTVFSVLGNKVAEVQVSSDQVSMPFNYKGVFIVQNVKDNRLLGAQKIVVR